MPVPGPVGPTPPPIAGGNNNYGLGERSVDNTKPQGQQQAANRPRLPSQSKNRPKELAKEEP